MASREFNAGLKIFFMSQPPYGYFSGSSLETPKKPDNNDKWGHMAYWLCTAGLVPVSRGEILHCGFAGVIGQSTDSVLLLSFFFFLSS